jgi:hypothetical protein
MRCRLPLSVALVVLPAVLLHALAVPRSAAQSPAVDGTWSQPVLAASPSPRVGATLLYDSVRHRALLFGGTTSTSSINETWALDLANPNGWELVAVQWPPLGRAHPNAVYDPVADRIWIWGGQNHTGAVYTEGAYLQFANAAGDSGTWFPFSGARDPVSGERPTGRYGSGCAYDPIGHRMVFYGGGYGNANLATVGTWALSLTPPATWHLLPTTSPHLYGGKFSNLLLDPIRNRWLLDYTLESTDYWQWPVWPDPRIFEAPHDLQSGWAELDDPPSPPADWVRLSAFHPLQDRIVAIGRRDVGLFYWAPIPNPYAYRVGVDTWQSLAPLNGPGPQYGGDDMIYDPIADRMVIYRDASPTIETWFLTWTGVSGVAESPPVARTFRAGPAHPMPFQREVAIPLEADRALDVSVLVLDGQGRRVRDLGVRRVEPGSGELRWDGRTAIGHAAPGVYFVRLASVDGNERVTVRVIRTK